jgi:hypothetical protein
MYYEWKYEYRLNLVTFINLLKHSIKTVVDDKILCSFRNLNDTH